MVNQEVEKFRSWQAAGFVATWVREHQSNQPNQHNQLNPLNQPIQPLNPEP
jgi:hypothetical protein